MARVHLRRDRKGRFLKRGSAARNDPGPKRRRRRNEPNPRRRRHRRNPALPSPRGIMNLAIGAAGDAAQLLVGEGVTGMVPGLIKQDKTTPLGMTIQAAGGLLLALVLAQVRVPFVNPRLIAASGFVGVGRGLVRKFNVPFLSNALSAYPTMQELAAYPQLEAYPARSQIVDIYGTSLAGDRDYAQLYQQ